MTTAAEQLLPIVYDDLRKLAAGMLARKPGQTLQATALVHEAYLRVANGQSDWRWESRAHFFAAAAEAMRRILIDRARQKNSAKRGGSFRRVPLDNGPSLVAPEGEPAENLLTLDEALRQLELEDPVKAQLVTLRFFAGLSLDDAAAILGISRATAKRYWIYARSWLYGKIREQ